MGIADKIYNMDCKKGMQQYLEDESVDLVVTSPPYFNARDYSQWETVDDYLKDMKEIVKEIYRVLKNHKVFVLNIGDIICKTGKQKYTSRKLPLCAYFIVMCEEIGFEFVDDFIWDKGEPQSKRHIGNPPYPLYQYPVNCYEHILIFHKHRLSKETIPCPICGSLKAVTNGQTEIGVYSWECKNPDCPQKSNKGRGKRFSERTIIMQDYQTEENKIDSELVKKWRRDIVKINPIVKVNSKGVNTIGHSAPFPKEIPEMAIQFFTGKGDLVLEPFAGSGTSLIVAKELGRNYIGFEIDNDYFNILKERLERLEG